jgi:lysophospholipase L1-like esterase
MGIKPIMKGKLMQRKRLYLSTSISILIVICATIGIHYLFLNDSDKEDANASQKTPVSQGDNNTDDTSNTGVVTNIPVQEDTGIISPEDIIVTAPTLNDSQDSAFFKVSNTSKHDLSVNVIVESFNNGESAGSQKYPITVKSGAQKIQQSIPAKKGDFISMKDNKENIYLQPFELGTQEWLGTWASAQQGLDPNRGEYPPAPGLENNTFRQIVRISVGGSQFRLKISNEYGRTPLVINSVHIAKHYEMGFSIIDPKTDTAVTFNGGSESVSIPAGQVVTSDVIDYNAPDLERIAISTYFGEVPEMVTSHTASRTTSYLVTGNHVSDISLESPATNETWYFITGIDVLSSPESKAIACLGDSTTDGRGVRTNYDDRWTDVLAERLVENPATAHISVLNQGIGGNSIWGGLGPAAVRRFKRDVLDQPKVGYVIIFEAINDIGYTNSPATADRLIEEYKKFADQAHAQGIKVIGATITPFGGTDYAKAFWDIREGVRQKLNEWIRTTDYFDGFIDFDAAIRDENDPGIMAKKFSSDGLHPNFPGYQKLGEAIDLSLFEQQ